MRALLRARGGVLHGLTPTGAARLRGAVALLGLLAALVATACLPPLGHRVPPWVWRFFVLWSVATPYWHWAEYRWLRDPAQGETARSDFKAGQTQSRMVWLGFGAVFAVWILAGVQRPI